jgi:tetratricopeptide (TPR) repeat protein
MVLTAPRAWALIAILAFAVYANALGAPFLLDDSVVVTQNVRLRGGVVDAVSQGPQTRALSNLTFYVNYRVAGTSAVPQNGSYGPTWTYHVFNVAIHAVNGILLFTLLSMLLGRLRADPLAPFASWVALGSTLLWLLHPVQTMAVTYICQRYALLAATALLSTLVSFTELRRWLEEGRGGSGALLAATLGCYLLCFLTKENAAVASLLVVAIEAVFFGGTRWRIPGALLGLSVLGVVAGVLVFGSGFFFPSRNAVFPDRASYLVTESVVVLEYLKLWFWPTGLTMEHAFPRLSWADVPGQLVLALVAHVLVLALAVVSWRRGRRFVSFAVAGYYLSLAPESSLVPLLDPMVEYRLYLPSAFLAGVVGWGLGRAALALERRRSVLLSAWAGLVLALGLGTLVRNEVYTPTAIWEDAIAKRPDAARGYASLGMELLHQGRWLEAVGPEAAALELAPYHVEAWTNLGKAWLEVGTSLPDGPRAIHPSPPLAWAREALRRGIAAAAALEPMAGPQPALPICWSNLGHTCLVLSDRTQDEGEKDALDHEAALAFEKAGALLPGARVSWVNLAAARARLGRRARGSERVALARGVLAALAKARVTGPGDPYFLPTVERFLFGFRELGYHALALSLDMQWLEARQLSPGSEGWLRAVGSDAAALADESVELEAHLERARAAGAGADDLTAEKEAAIVLGPHLAGIGEGCETVGARLAPSAPAEAGRLYRSAARIARAAGDLARARHDYALALPLAAAADREAWASEAKELDR